MALSPNADLGALFFAFGFRGRPARPTVEVLADLIDGCVGGGSFELGSACFDSMCVITGQLDAYVEPGPRLIEEIPELRAEFERVGGGQVLNNSPYDLAAAVLCLQEAGATVTDASGRPLDDRLLLGSGLEYQMSIVAAGNAELPRPAAGLRGRRDGPAAGPVGAARLLGIFRAPVTPTSGKEALASARRRGPQVPGRLHAHRR